MAVLELTYACNHQCIFCSCPWDAPNNPLPRGKEMELDAWKLALTQLAGWGVTHFAFTGGEPTLKTGWAELVAHAAGSEAIHFHSQDGILVEKRAPPGLTFLSNGKNLSEKDMEVLAQFKVDLSISLPGLETFPEHTGGGDPVCALEAIRSAKAMGLKVTAGITVTRLNVPELELTLSAALLAGADQVLLNRFLPGGRGLAHLGLALNLDELKEALEVTEATLERAGRLGNMGTELPACAFEKSRYPHLQIGTGCAAAKEFFAVGPNGQIRACNHSPMELGSLDELDALPRNPIWRQFALGDCLPSPCRNCAQAGHCAGGCRAAAMIMTGAADGPDPLLASYPISPFPMNSCGSST